MSVLVFLGCVLGMLAPNALALVIVSYAGGWLASTLTCGSIDPDRIAEDQKSEDAVVRLMAGYRRGLLSGNEWMLFSDALMRGSLVCLLALLMRSLL